MEHYGIGPAYVELLKRLCSQQEGTVKTDKTISVFPIKRGTKQGDSMSTPLFHTVLQFSLKDDLVKWQENQNGIGLSDKEGCLTNLRFEDDVLDVVEQVRKDDV